MISVCKTIPECSDLAILTESPCWKLFLTPPPPPVTPLSKKNCSTNGNKTESAEHDVTRLNLAQKSVNMDSLLRFFYYLTTITNTNIFIYGKTILCTKFEYGMYILNIIFKMRMECDISGGVSLRDNDCKNEISKNLIERPETPETPECTRADTPSSDTSTSGVCSMASSVEDGPETPDEFVDEEMLPPQEEPVIMHQGRDILDLFSNIRPFKMVEPAVVPPLTMSSYWNGRSIYHRLGPYGTLDEFDFETCFYCDFETTVPKF